MTLPISGMSCAACAGRVERALAAVPGIASARVNLAGETVALEGAAPLPALAAGLRRAGYALREEVLDWSLAGMSCATCTGRVERALLAVPGVIEAAANLATDRVTLRVLAGTDPARLEAALRVAGYALAAEVETGRAWSAEAAWLALASLLAAPLLVGMAGMAFGADWMPPPFVQAALAGALLFGPGLRFHRGALAAVRAGVGNMDLLVSLGTGAAFLLSLWLMARGHAHELYFEAAGVVILFVLLGKWLEARAHRATGAALQALLDLRPRTARRVLDGGEEEVPAALLRVGETIAIRPGERVPADATVLEGEAAADEAPLTGESHSVEKRPGEALATGTTILDGRLLARVTATGDETVLARVAALVAAAQSSRAPVQQMVDRVSAVFVPVVVGIAVATLLGWLAAGTPAEAAIIHAVSVLVVACPCALGLATPAAIMAGTGSAARAGILLRDAEAIERGAGITAVAFDKTGTLTEGRPRLAAVHGADEALRLAAALQAGSEHPLARAVVTAHAAAHESAPPPVDGFRALPGIGVRGVVEARALRLGSARLLADASLDDPFAAEAAAEASRGRSLAWLIEEGRGVLALLAFEDTPRPGAAAAVASLRERGLRVLLLSGDNEAAARALAGPLDIAEVEASLLPEDKLSRIAALQAGGHRVAMVGDGINDAPALAGADLGIAMGSGTDAAMAAAPVTLLRPDPRLVPAALDVARRTSSRIRQNLFFAFSYNAALLPLAALGMLSPAMAGGAMALSSVSVLANALGLARSKPA